MSDAIESQAKHIAHKNAVQRKYERIAGKQAIHDTWIMEDYDCDMEYLKDLKRRIRQAEVNLIAMRP